MCYSPSGQIIYGGRIVHYRNLLYITRKSPSCRYKKVSVLQTVVISSFAAFSHRSHLYQIISAGLCRYGSRIKFCILRRLLHRTATVLLLLSLRCPCTQREADSITARGSGEWWWSVKRLIQKWWDVRFECFLESGCRFSMCRKFHSRSNATLIRFCLYLVNCRCYQENSWDKSCRSRNCAQKIFLHFFPQMNRSGNIEVLTSFKLWRWSKLCLISSVWRSITWQMFLMKKYTYTLQITRFNQFRNR